MLTESISTASKLLADRVGYAQAAVIEPRGNDVDGIPIVAHYSSGVAHPNNVILKELLVIELTALGSARVAQAYFLARANNATPNGNEIVFSRSSSTAIIWLNTRFINDFPSISKSRPAFETRNVRAMTASGNSKVVQ
jgi:hypothetical protein